MLSKQYKLEANNRLFKLDPYVNAQSVLRVGCTIQKSLIQQEIKHLVLLQKDCSISKCHDQVAYARKDITFNQVRMSSFWVLGLKMIV